MGAAEPDPFAPFLRPPANETAGERSIREAREAEAKRISDEIDEQLKAERTALKRQKNTVRILFLGQSESGKSTTLKNFRMKYARDDWEAERTSWRSVIQLNLVRSIINIVETLQAEMDGDPPSDPMTPATPGSVTANSDEPSSRPSGDSSRMLSRSNSLRQGTLSSLLTDKHRLLKLRLGPLRRVEMDLRKRLGAGADEEPDGAPEPFIPDPLEADIDFQIPKKRMRREFSVRRLREALQNGISHTGGSSIGHGTEESSGSVDEPTDVIAQCREDMSALWSDDAVRVILKKRRVRTEDSAGFFLDDLHRIATRHYEPSDDDVVRARLRTMGVQEYKIQFETSSPALFSNGVGSFGKDWVLYDVGGSRTMRHAWVPFFENIHAIIFLAPISCFDERLLEDSRVNRLEDSFLLWRTISSSKLLAKTSMVLFMNKCDLLKRKLKAGVKIKHYLPSYGDRPNDMGSVVKYLRDKFKEILKQHSPEPRTGYFYPTSVIDTKATASTIKAVKDSITRDHLKTAELV